MILEHLPPHPPFAWLDRVVDDFGDLVILGPDTTCIDRLVTCPWSQARAFVRDQENH